MTGPVADRVLIARVGAAHGIKGEVRVKAFTGTPADIAAYGPLEAPDGRLFEVETLRPAAGNRFSATVTGPYQLAPLSSDQAARTWYVSGWGSTAPPSTK